MLMPPPRRILSKRILKVTADFGIVPDAGRRIVVVDGLLFRQGARGVEVDLVRSAQRLDQFQKLLVGLLVFHATPDFHPLLVNLKHRIDPLAQFRLMEAQPCLPQGSRFLRLLGSPAGFSGGRLTAERALKSIGHQSSDDQKAQETSAIHLPSVLGVLQYKNRHLGLAQK